MLIHERLRKKNLFSDEIKTYIEQSLRHGTPKLDQVTIYADMVKERVSREYLESVSERLNDFTSGVGDDADKDPMDMASEVIKSLQDLQKRNQEKKVRLIRDQMFQIVQAVNSREATGEIENLGYSIKPFYDLNSALSGFRKAFMYGIAGAPRRGKTSLTLELATCVATNAKIPVLFITWEQTKLNLTYRLLAKESQLNPDTLQRKRIMSNEDQEAKFALGWRKMEKYMDYFYLVEGTKRDTVDKIKAHAYNIMQNHESDDLMIVVDYIQKMPVKNDIADEKFKVEEISTQLKGLSIELNCPVIAISSLNKEGCAIDAEDSKVRPNMYHCKGSGDIEYDLDSAMILAKDWEDTRELAGQLSAKAENIGKDPVNIPKIDIVNVHIDKNRDAPEGISNVVQFLFLIESNKFIELGFKVETDHYRFTKIENLVNKLMEEEYIVFRDLNAGPEGEVSTDAKNSRRKKIRLRY
jgi:replicative DNA helicase